MIRIETGNGFPRHLTSLPPSDGRPDFSFVPNLSPPPPGPSGRGPSTPAASTIPIDVDSPMGRITLNLPPEFAQLGPAFRNAIVAAHLTRYAANFQRAAVGRPHSLYLSITQIQSMLLLARNIFA